MKFISIMFLIFLSACNNIAHNDNRSVSSNSEGFKERKIQTELFTLTVYERINSNNGITNVYIEGDGRAWLGKKVISLDPTPKNPVAFKLASQDSASNVIYLARPCQYTKMSDGSACKKRYWTSHRFSPEVIEAMNHAVDSMKRRYQLKGFNLIGFSGGGNVAALLAAKRYDVLSLRTIAGNLNHKLQSKIHDVSVMPASLNAVDIANKISHIPQIHFVGGGDKVVPIDIAKSFKAAVIDRECLQIQVIEEIEHVRGWETAWRSLLSQPLHCKYSK